MRNRRDAYARPAAALTVAATSIALMTGTLLGGPSTGFSPSRPLTSALGLAMLVAAGGIRRGKRRAGDLAGGLLLAVAVIGAAAGGQQIQTAWVGGLALALLATRRALPATGGAPALRWGLATATMVTLSFGLAAATLLATDRVSAFDSALNGAASWLAAGGAWLDSTTPLAVSVDAFLAVALVTAAVFLRALLRPAPVAEGHTEPEHARAAAIVAAYGTDSLDPFALREDKAFHFAAGGVLAYRTLRETAVVSGDPIGPPGAAPEVLASFEAHAAARGWNVVLTGASARYLDAFRAAGLRTVCIGEEAVVDPRRFTLEGRAIRKVRQSVTRLQRHGWRIGVVEASALDPALTDEIGGVERAWRAGHPRMSGFAMTLGRLWGAEEDRRGMYVVARDADGDLRAFLRFAEYDGGLSLDATRRLGNEPNGLTEAMVVAALGYARDRGVHEVSLNFAGFAHVMAAGAAASRGQRLARRLLRIFHGRFQLERLVQFSDKFGPDWRPRYLIQRGRTGLPLAALRVLQAEAYVRPPTPRPLKARWEPRAVPVALGRRALQSP